MEPTDILVRSVATAEHAPHLKLAWPANLQADLLTVLTCQRNRAPARLILACALAKAHQPQLDATEPYTEIRSGRSFSGRTYDERYISPLVISQRLPLNPTTAFLTPTLCNANQPLRSSTAFEGRPRDVYPAAARILEALEEGQLEAENVLAVALQELLIMRDAQEADLQAALSNLSAESGSLSTEDVITLLEQHLRSRNASRLPVLLVAALYQTLGALAGEQALSLGAHNAADARTGALGDIEIELLTEKGKVVTVYEVKARAVSVLDIQQATQKVVASSECPENYLFVTTHPIDREVTEYAHSLHGQIGVEFAVLDALSFARNLLHFFHRHRVLFLDAYQALILAEPDSAVRPELKMSWLALRQAAES